MQISRDEAARALTEIDEARESAQSFSYYRRAAPYFLIWGVVWIAANTMTAFKVAYANTFWAWAVALGVLASVLTGVLAARGRPEDQEAARVCAQRNRRFGLSFLAIVVFLVTGLMIMRPTSGMQMNAYISLFWALMYVLAGLWGGARIAWLGIVVAIAVLVGYFGFPQYYTLWMAVVGGGSLLLGGLILRRA
jgi:hypothetical protein